MGWPRVYAAYLLLREVVSIIVYLLVASSIWGVEWLFRRRGVVSATTIQSWFRKSSVLAETATIVSALPSDMVNGGVGEVTRLQLKYAGVIPSSAKPPASVVVKRLGNSVNGVILNVIAELGDREALAYRHLPSILGNIMPRCFASNVHWCGVGSIVLEDLGSLRSIKSLESQVASVADIAALLRSVGTLHGRTWNNSAVVSQFAVNKSSAIDALFNSMVDRVMSSGVADAFSGPAVSVVLKQLCDFDTFQAHLRLLRGRGIGDPVDKLPRPFVICHQDPRLDNAFPS